MKTVNDYLHETDYDGHLILKKDGKEIANTIRDHGDFPPDGLFYEIVEIESVNSDVVVMIVK